MKSKRLEGAFYGALLFFMIAPVVFWEASKRGFSALWPERSGPVRIALCGGSLVPLAGLAAGAAILWPVLGPVWAILVSIGIGAALGAAFGAVISDLRALPPPGTPGALENSCASVDALCHPGEEATSQIMSAMGEIATAQVEETYITGQNDGIIASPGVEISITLPPLDPERVYSVGAGRPRWIEGTAPPLRPRTLPPVLKADEIARPGKCVSCAGMRYVPGGGDRGLVKCERCWHIGAHEGGSPWLPIS